MDDLDRARERAAGGEHVKQVQQRLDGCVRFLQSSIPFMLSLTRRATSQLHEAVPAGRRDVEATN